MTGSVRNRVLAVLRILIRNTDEDKTLTTPELIELLNGQGITADRRSIYEDIVDVKLREGERVYGD